VERRGGGEGKMMREKDNGREGGERERERINLRLDDLIKKTQGRTHVFHFLG